MPGQVSKGCGQQEENGTDFPSVASLSPPTAAGDFSFSLHFYLSLIVLGLQGCTQAFSSCSKLASHCSSFSCCEARDLDRGLNRCSSQAWGPHGMGHPPKAGIEPLSPALAGRFLTTGPPGKSLGSFLKYKLKACQLPHFKTRRTIPALISDNLSRILST